MKKVSNVVLLIGGILAFLEVFGLIVAGIVMLVLGSPACTNIIVEGVKNGTVHVSGQEGTPEEIAVVAQLILVITGIVMFLISLPTVAAGVVALIARVKEKDGLYIASIVLGIVSGYNFVIIAGGILGLIKEKNSIKEEVQE